MQQSLGKRIQFHRKSLGLTQDQLAEQLGVTAQAVSKWENDLSCPDISTLPQLARIFGISVDALLGAEPAPETVHEAEVVEEQEPNGFHIQTDGLELNLGSSRKAALSFALTVLAVGIQLFAQKLLRSDITFWSILWPTVLVVFGGVGLLTRFSFLRLGFLLFGAYFLLDGWQVLPFSAGTELILPAIVVILGISLLVDALKKKNGHRFHIGGSSEDRNDFHTDADTFTYSASFGENTQTVSLPVLSNGKVSCSFGDYTVDLTEVASVSADCQLDVSCSFGEVELLVPRRFAVKPNTDTSFGEVSISGQPDPQPAGVIRLKGGVSFGEIEVRYL